MSGLRRKKRNKKNGWKGVKYKKVNKTRGSFANLMAPGIHQIFLQFLQTQNQVLANAVLSSSAPIFSKQPFFVQKGYTPLTDTDDALRALCVYLMSSGMVIPKDNTITLSWDLVEQLKDVPILGLENYNMRSVSFKLDWSNMPSVISPQPTLSPNVEVESNVVLLALAKQAGGSFKIDRKFFAEVLKELSKAKSPSVEVDTEQDDEFVRVRIK